MKVAISRWKMCDPEKHKTVEYHQVFTKNDHAVDGHLILVTDDHENVDQG